MVAGSPVLVCVVMTNPLLHIRGACWCSPLQEGAPSWLPPTQLLRLASGLPLSAPRENIARSRGRADPAAGALHQHLQARCSEESSLSLPQKEREKDEAVLHFRVSVTTAARGRSPEQPWVARSSFSSVCASADQVPSIRFLQQENGFGGQTLPQGFLPSGEEVP